MNYFALIPFTLSIFTLVTSYKAIKLCMSMEQDTAITKKLCLALIINVATLIIAFFTIVVISSVFVLSTFIFKG